MRHLRVGVDVGGTFTDLVLEDAGVQLARVKVPSTPAGPTEAVISGLRRLVADVADVEVRDLEALVHGTTVATNAVIQEGWARTGLITSEGFRDIIEIRRQTRPDVYDLRVGKPRAIVPRDMRLEVPERVRADGSIRVPLDEDAVREAVLQLVAVGARAIAVCFLHSYAHPAHERRAVEIIGEEAPDLYVTASFQVVAEFREYPRVSTTIVNAALGPVMSDYLAALTRETRRLGLPVEPRVMQSNGGIASPGATARRPVHTLVSGPTAGVIGAVEAAQRSDVVDLVTFDVGGTSTDVCLVEHGKPVTTAEKAIAGYPLRGAMVDVHSIGAGGGSIAWIDTGGFLCVGPQSSGAVPGPACYGGGGGLPTVTDANLVLGRLSEGLLGGKMRLDKEAAVAAIETIAQPLGLQVAEAADAVIRVANANMARAIRLVSVERGHDPREFTLVAFGGAGSLHVVEVGREVGFRTALIPGAPGLLSAHGLLAAPIRGDFARTYPFNVSDGEWDGVDAAFLELEDDAHHWLEIEAPNEKYEIRRALDLRYIGQSFETTVPLEDRRLSTGHRSEVIERFYQEYARLYGTAPPAPVEAVTLRVTGAVAETTEREVAIPSDVAPASAIPDAVRRQVFFASSGFVETPVHSRSDLGGFGRLEGPLIVDQDDSTAVIPPGAAIEWDDTGNILVLIDGSDGRRSAIDH